MSPQYGTSFETGFRSIEDGSRAHETQIIKKAIRYSNRGEDRIRKIFRVRTAVSCAFAAGGEPEWTIQSAIQSFPIFSDGFESGSSLAW